MTLKKACSNPWPLALKASALITSLPRFHDYKSCCKYGWKIHTKKHQNHWKLVHFFEKKKKKKKKKIFPWAHAFSPRSPSQSRASRLHTGVLTFGASEMDMTTPLFPTRLFLIQVYLNFPPYKQKLQLQIFLKELRKTDMPQVKITCIFMTTSFKSICLLCQTSRLKARVT